MERPILITGAPRSGKTLIAGVLDICKVFSGATDVMLENIDVREVMARYLKQQGADPKGQNPILPALDMDVPVGWKERVDNIILQEGFDGGGAWMLKSAKIALTWPVWYAAYPKARWVIVRRRTGDIVESCMKTDYMKAYDDKEGWVEMVRHYEDRFVELISEGVDCKVIWPQRMVYGDYSQVYELLDWLGLGWRTEVLAYIDPKFWRIRKKQENGKSITQ